MEGLWSRSISPVPPITIGSSGDTLTHNTLKAELPPMEKSASSIYGGGKGDSDYCRARGKNEREEEE